MARHQTRDHVGATNLDQSYQNLPVNSTTFQAATVTCPSVSLSRCPRLHLPISTMKTSRYVGKGSVTRSSSGRPRWRTTFVSMLAVVPMVLGALGPTTALASQAISPTPAPTVLESGHCPWVAQSLHHAASPSALSNEVLSQMTLAQKAAFVVLRKRPPLQNENIGVPSLCIPPLSMSDGPSGLANGLQGVTQFPSPIAVAATWNPRIARAVGVAIAEEARTKGISAVQATEMNLARVPQSGRIFETYGEDPYLASILGVANILGIQSRGIMDNAKHYSAYTQETARVRLNQLVSPRALAELYNVPFRSAVQQAHVASLMCSYGKLNGVNTCSSPALYQTLRSWGFSGFVRSDMQAVPNVALAFRAGISVIKPALPSTVEHLVRTKFLALSDLNRAVHAVLTQMFRFGLIAHPLTGSLYAKAVTPAHALVALHTAENSIVLLKNAGSILPLGKNVTSVAVIGDTAGQRPLVAGGGSSAVVAPYVITPLSALRAVFGRRVHVTYKPGGPPGLELDRLGDVDIVGGTPLSLVTPINGRPEPGKADVLIVDSPNVTPALATATSPGTSEGWMKWSAVVRAVKTGTYELSFQQVGDTWLYLNGHEILSSPGLHIRSDIATTVSLVAGRRYEFSAAWFAVRGHRAPQFGIQDVTPQINAAVAAARRSQVAIVFAGDYNQEGTDRANLNLPGVGNALISAVAAVNPHTIVVLNTGGAVYMPWLSHVAAVLEAWYPGQEDGTAIAAVLTGRVNPSGRLPITFPTDRASTPLAVTSQFPGVNGVVNFSTGLNIGYRWYQTNRVTPLFPFGFGLGYSSFSLSDLKVTKSVAGVVVHVTVANVGPRLGADVVQVYVHYPSGAGEPPEQLRTFARVRLAPSANTRVSVTIPWSGFQTYRNSALTTLAGRYGIDVGHSSVDLSLHASVSLP